MAYSGNSAWCFCLKICVLGGLLLAAGPVVASENYPQREITLVIPYGMGGTSDVLFRDVFSVLGAQLKQPVLIKNMPGSGASRGARYVKEASPDGYTLLASHQTVDLSYLAGQASFSHESFAPVTLLTRTVNIPTTYAGHAARQASDIAVLVESQATPLAFGVIPNSTDHFFWLQLFERSGISPANVLLVHFPDTASQVEALLAREIDFAMLNLPSAGQLFASSSLVPLAVAGQERLPALPDVSTLREQGIDMVNTTDRGIFAPAGTPPERLAVLANALARTMDDTQLRHRIIHEYGSLVDYRPLTAYGDYLNEQFHMLEPLIERVNFKR